jgi:hypothetical protein
METVSCSEILESTIWDIWRQYIPPKHGNPPYLEQMETKYYSKHWSPPSLRQENSSETSRNLGSHLSSYIAIRYPRRQEREKWVSCAKQLRNSAVRIHNSRFTIHWMQMWPQQLYRTRMCPAFHIFTQSCQRSDMNTTLQLRKTQPGMWNHRPVSYILSDIFLIPGL